MNYTITQTHQASPEDIAMIQAGLDGFNRQHGIQPIQPIAVFLRDKNQAIVGGVYGELGLNWLYIDLLWIADSHKAKGYGRQLMHSIEQYTLRQGVPHVHLATTSFQALPFYIKVGYELFSVIEDRPPGHRYYYLKKSVTRTEGEQLPIVINPKRDDVNTVIKGLRAHTLANRVDMVSVKVTLFLRDSQNSVVGGLLGSIYWGWLDLQALWIDDSARGQGYGKQLLTMAEQITRENGSPHIFTDVVELQTLPFFLNHGFKTFATLPNRPLGHETHFLRKDL